MDFENWSPKTCLSFIEEWERSGYRMDYDRDTIPNFYDLDDDGDKLPTSVELGADLNPFNSADAHGDKDSDGLDNLWEYENGTMITDADTDHNGINDGEEYKYWQESLYELWGTWENVNETAVKYIKNPDVDKDNVTDGKEINGWTVKIIVDYDEDNNPISKDVALYGDPLAAYKDPEGNYIDSDEDNIPDIVESLLSNNSTFAKFARLFADPTSEYYDLWTSYNWTIAYFFSVRNNRNFHYYLDLLDANKYSAEQIARYITEWNNTAPHNKSCAENATQWLRDEFNPLITESMAPVITEFHVSTIYEGYVAPLVPNAKAHVVAEIRDVAGISRVRIKSVCPDVFGIMTWTIVKEYDGTQTSVYLDEIIDVTEVSAVLTYNISVNATDTLGNSAEWYKEVDGPIGVVIKTIAKALAMFWDFLCEVGAKILEGLNILFQFIMEIIERLVKPLIDAIKNGLLFIAGKFAYVISEIINLFHGGGSTALYASDNNFDYEIMIGAGLLIALMVSLPIPLFMAVMGGLQVAETVLKPFYPIFVVIPFILLGLLLTAILDAFGANWAFGEIPLYGLPQYMDPFTVLDIVNKIPSEAWWWARWPLVSLSIGKVVGNYIIAWGNSMPFTTAFTFAISMIAFVLYLLSAITSDKAIKQTAAIVGLLSAAWGMRYAISSLKELPNTPITTAATFTWATLGLFVGVLNVCKVFGIS